MSWFKSAFSKAAEAGGKNLGPNLTKTVKNYAGSVYQQAGQAVAGGAKIVQDRLAGRNLNNFKHAVRRLDEVALNARGEERKQALARWLGALQDIDKELKHPVKRTESFNTHKDEPESPRPSLEEESGLSPRRASMVLFFDSDTGGELLNFRDVFLRSHAVENIVTSLILEAPAEEEVSMLLEIFELCLTGGKELHDAIVSSIQDLSNAVSSYVDEVLIKREELLQMARDAISGLKLNPEVERLDAEMILLKHQISEKEGALGLKDEHFKDPSIILEATQLQVRLRQCLQRKYASLQGGDSPKDRALKVQKLKDFINRLNSSSQEIQKQLLDNRQQKQEAVNFRISKAQEVTEVEKVVAGEVRELDRRRQELETELKEVKAALAAATSRHIHTQEEKEQFDEASSNIVAHFSSKEEELLHSITSRTTEERVVSTWADFLEDTWVLQSASDEQIVKETKLAWEESRQQFFQIAAINLACRQEEADLFLKRLKFYADELDMLRQKKENVAEEELIPDIIRGIRKTKTSYLDTEMQVDNIFKVLAQLEEEVRAYRSSQEEQESEAESKLGQAFEAIAILRHEFEAQQRPDIEVEKAESKAIQQGRAMFERARAQVIETGDMLRAVTSKNDSLKNHSTEQSPRDGNASSQVDEIPCESPPSEDLDDLGGVEDLPQGETEGWEFDELEEEVSTEGTDK